MHIYTYIECRYVECRYNAVPIYHDITHDTAMTGAERRSDVQIIIDTQISPSMADYMVPVVRILEKIARVITAPHCVYSCIIC